MKFLEKLQSYIDDNILKETVMLSSNPESSMLYKNCWKILLLEGNHVHWFWDQLHAGSNVAVAETASRMQDNCCICY